MQRNTQQLERSIKPWSAVSAPSPSSRRGSSRTGEKKMWDECLALWKRLSEMDDCDVSEHVEVFKDNILNDLGYSSMKHGCPFCERHFVVGDCPIGDCDDENLPPCYDTPYRLWEDHYRTFNRHSQQAAKAFYEFLLELKTICEVE